MKPIGLTITRAAFRDIVAGLHSNPHGIAFCPAGLSRLPERIDVLVRQVRWSEAEAPEHGPFVLAHRLGIAGDYVPNSIAAALSMRERAQPMIVLGLGTGQDTGRITGGGNADGKPLQLDRIELVGPGARRVVFAQRDPLTEVSNPDLDMWSRSIGALGQTAWQRLTELRVAVVGVGRTGSLIANSLAGLGLRRLILIDADRIENHNRGEMEGIISSDVGRKKVDALEGFLRNRADDRAVDITVCGESILTQQALLHFKRCDFVFCCVDNPAARLATAHLSSLYLKPLLDIGTGIFSDTGGVEASQMGFDVRLIVPGDRCLRCMGGISDRRWAQAEIHWQVNPRSAENWRTQRAGSLRSLNALAAAHGQRLLEEFVRGRIRQSIWLQMDIGASGIPTLANRTLPRIQICKSCARAGEGDSGLYGGV